VQLLVGCPAAVSARLPSVANLAAVDAPHLSFFMTYLGEDARKVNNIEFWHPAGGPIVSTLEQAHAHLADKQQGRIPPVRLQAAMLFHLCKVHSHSLPLLNVPP
jgi:hypothetical protein